MSHVGIEPGEISFNSFFSYSGELANFILLGVQLYCTDLFLGGKFAWWAAS